MAQVKDNLGLISFFGALIFTESALLAGEGTAALAGPVTGLVAGFEGLHAEELAEEREAQQVLARMRIGDLYVDRRLRGLQVDLLAEVKQERGKLAYKQMFGEGIAEVIKYGLDRQVVEARRILALLEGKDAPYSAALVKAHAPALKEAIELGDQILKERDAHAVKQAHLRIKLQAWKADCNTVFLAVEGELLKLASAQGEKRAWTKNFFG